MKDNVTHAQGKTTSRWKKILIRTCIVLGAVIVLAAGAFYIWALDYYRADETALAILESENVTRVENTYVITPEQPNDSLFIYYPGAKVEAISYLPLLQNISERTDMTCVLVEMPLNLAFLDSGAATNVIARYPEMEKIYMAGHSLGSAMASSYAADNTDNVDGVIVMGGYVYGDYPAEKSLTIYGTFDAEHGEHVKEEGSVLVIEGGNHAQFGNYGKQAGDADATITAQEQQDLAAEAVADFVK